MKKLLIFTFFICLNSNAADNLSANINNYIKASKYNQKHLGLVILKDGKVIYELNSNSLMTPASLTKIFTAGAVYSSMPMNTKFSTELWSNAQIENNVLKGDLCFKGGGDPSFVSEKMWYLVNEFSRNEVKSITGDIIIDSSRFDDELFDSGRDSVRVDRAFDAPISATSFNWNSVNVFIRPGKANGEAAKVFLDPINTYLELDNRAKTTTSNGKKTIEVQRVKSGDHDKIIVTGSIPLNSNEAVVYKSISNPVLWTSSHLVQFLKQRNIEFNGKIKIGQCLTNSTKLASVDSKNLNEIMSDMLKFSNNYVAEMMAKNLAAFKQEKSSPAKMKDGIEEIKKFIDTIGINRKDYTLENVSGLTRDNKFTANQIAKALIAIKSDFLMYPEYISGLPIAGVDGTLKSRMKNKSDLIVRAKTGYLDGVVGLAGYVGQKDKEPLVFAFMFNGGYEDAINARKLFDGILERVNKE